MVRPVLGVDSADSYHALVEQVIAGGGLAGVTRLLADMLGLPAAIANEEFEPMYAFAPRGKHLPAEDATLPVGLRDRIAFDLDRTPRASTDPPTLLLAAGDRHFAVAPVVLPTGILAYVWVADPSGQPSPRTRRVVSHAAAASTLELVRQRAIVEGESRVRSSFLEDLLTSPITSINSTRRRARFLGYDLTSQQVIVALDLDNFSTYIDEHGIDENGIQRLKERFRRSFDASMPAIWSQTLVWEHSDALVILAPVAPETDPQALTRRVEALRSAVEARLKGPSISAGVGRSYDDLRSLKDSYLEAEHALRIGAVVSGPSTTSAFDDLGAYRLLYHLREHSELDVFYEETAGALERYDESHGTDLLLTLQTFLSLHGNLTQTARRLHLHRNGLLYRLARIEAIAGCDLDDPSQRLAFQLAILARPLLSRKPLLHPLNRLSSNGSQPHE